MLGALCAGALAGCSADPAASVARGDSGPDDAGALDATTGPEGDAGADRDGRDGGGAALDAGGRDAAPPPKLVPSGPLVIKGQNGSVIEGLKISSTDGDCVRLEDSVGVTLRGSEIGPCAGNAVVILGGTGVHVEDNYIHPEHPPSACCDTGDGVFASGTSALTIAGNVIAYGEANIEVLGSEGVKVLGNFLLNPQNGGSRGQNFQAWSGCKDLDVENNYTLSSLDPRYTLKEKQEDSINFGESDGIVAKGNYVVGGHSPSGCGIIADDGASNATFSNNVLIDTGQCGINVSNGQNHAVDGNRVINSTPVEGGGNTALVVWNEYPGACGPVSVTNNVASALKPDLATESGYWNGGGCDPVTLSGNVLDQAARALLTPVAQKLPPPLIPPGPVTCVAPSPYANQAGRPPCASP